MNERPMSSYSEQTLIERPAIRMKGRIPKAELRIREDEDERS